MTSAIDGSFSLTIPTVMAHPNLHEAKPFKGKDGKPKGDPKFSASFVFDNPKENVDLNGLKAVMAAVARAKWPDVDLKTVKFPLTSGEKLIEKRKAKLKGTGKEYDGKADFQAGKVILKASSKYAPRLSGVENGKLLDYEAGSAAWTAAKGKFYFGVLVLAQFNFVAYEGDDDGDGIAKKGVTAYLNMVMTTNKGDRLSGGAAASEVFKGYAGSLSGTDPTVGEDLDDEIPF